MNRREALARTAWILGGALSAPTLHAMNRWEKMVTKQMAPGQGNAILSEAQQAITSRVAALIIPRTDTPGALDVGVPGFIELMLRDCYQKPAQIAFLTGLGELENKKFLTLSTDRQINLLQQIEADAGKASGPAFWRIVKELTLLGYFSSEEGIRASFDYQPIPGRFEAIKIRPGQKDFMYGNKF